MNLRNTIGVISLIIALTASPLSAQWLDDPKSESHIQKGVEYVYNLSFDLASAEFREVVRRQPDHPAGYFFLAMVDWWRIITDIENTSLDEKFLTKLDKVIDLCDERLDENEDDVAALFFKGGSLGFQGRLHGNREDWIKAANAGRSALPIVQRTYKLAPTNFDVLFGIGIYNYYADVIPSQYPFVKPLMIFFPDGNRDKGLIQLRKAAEHAKYANIEATYFLLQILFNYEKQYGEALTLASSLHERYPNNVIFHKYVGRCYAALGNHNMSRTIFTEIMGRVEKNTRGYDRGVEREARYYLGVEAMQSKQYDDALRHLYSCDEISRTLDKEEFTSFMVLANLRIGMIYDLQTKRDLAVTQYRKVLDMKDYQRAHEQAERYLKTPYNQS